jgi:hypothetical protein
MCSCSIGSGEEDLGCMVIEERRFLPASHRITRSLRGAPEYWAHCRLHGRLWIVVPGHHGTRVGALMGAPGLGSGTGSVSISIEDLDPDESPSIGVDKRDLMRAEFRPFLDGQPDR